MKTVVMSASILLTGLMAVPTFAAEEKGVSLEPVVNLSKKAIPAGEGAPKDTLVPISVRVPEGDVDTFWNQQEWTDLNPAEQALWAALGWNEVSWNEKEPAPASESKKWLELTEAEFIAAQQLGYSQESWDTVSEQAE
ncbi:hypothetical protein [Candidatus Albibeggiatoa sp. nov. NOAA]|uniref:hypothetical protein n=1 Tax=Candidatus Albibeggiatoa sp. nov. NOAA TaxID=3162724 RepID=UPI0032FA3F5A|nr:hypothetical protein [Thiotrichaceae bacterium]